MKGKRQYITEVKSLGHGITRLGAAGYGYADVAATCSDEPQGWTVEITGTNIVDKDVRQALVAEFRQREGLDKARRIDHLTSGDWEEIEALDLVGLDRQHAATLSESDWLRVEERLREKLARLKGGFYGKDRTARDWQAHIEEIIAKVEGRV